MTTGKLACVNKIAFTSQLLASYRQIVRIQIVEGVHVAVDMKQVTLHCHAHVRTLQM